MKRFIAWMFVLMAVSVNVLLAQDMTGTWQGTLKAGQQELRIVIQITKDDGKLAAKMYSLNQGGAAIAASAVTQSGSSIKIAIATLGGSYEGKLSPEGNTMIGTFTQGADLPLNLVKATPDTTWTIPEAAPPPKKMAADAKPQIEVATIKPSRPDSGFMITLNQSGTVITQATTLSDLIKFAYDLHPRQITGGPSWFEMDRYDVTGKPDIQGLPSMNQLKDLMKGLLADRFALKFHMEKKELSVYAITAAKSGVKMTKNESDPNGLPGFGGRGGTQGMIVHNATMAELATVLQANILELPVVDQTGLGAARYDFTVKWTPDPSQRGFGGAAPPPAASVDADAPPDLFAAFLQQLGLRLEGAKAPVDVMVIDHVNKPSDN